MEFSKLGNFSAFAETLREQVIFFFIPGYTLVTFFGEGFELGNGEENRLDSFGLIIRAIAREYFSGYTSVLAIKA